MLSVAHEGLGSLARERGELEAEATHFVELLKIAKQRQGILGDTPEVLDTLLLAHWGLGSLARERGDSEAAATHFAELLKIAEQSHGLLGETPDALRWLSRAHERLGTLALFCGDTETAATRFTEALRLDMQRHGVLGNSPEVLGSLSASHSWLGDVSLDCGDLETAETHYAEALRLAEQRHGLQGDTPAVLESLSVAHDGLGRLARERSDLETAATHFAELLRIAKKRHCILGNTPGVLSSLSVARERLGDLAQDCGDLASANTHFSEVLSIDVQRNSLLGDTPDVMYSISIARSRSAEVARDRGSLSVAEQHYRAGIEFAETYYDVVRGIKPARQFLLNRLSESFDFMVYDRSWLAAYECFVECWQKAAALAIDDDTILRLADALGRPALDLLHRSESRAHSEQRAVLIETLRTLAEQVVDAVERSDAYDNGDVRHFFSQYLTVAVQDEPSEVPFVLSLIQGRDLASIVLDDLQEMDGFPLPEAQQRFREARQQLKKAALHLKVIEGRNDGSGCDPSGAGGRGLGLNGNLDGEVDSDARRLAQQAYDQAFEAHKLAKAELVRDNPDYAFAVQRPDMRIGFLQDRVRRDEAIVLLVAIREEDNDKDGFGNDNVANRGPAPIYAVVVRQMKTPVSVAIPSLSPALQYVPALESAFASRGFRRITRKASSSLALPNGAASAEVGLSQSPGDAPDITPANTSPTKDLISLDWEEWLKEHLWQPLAPHLRGIRDIHLVTHDALHAVPWNVGRQDCRLYPGLLFYEVMNHTNSERPRASGNIGLRHYTPPEADRAIPFVEAEAALVNAIWAPAPTTNQYPSPAKGGTRVDYVHLAGHGQAVEGRLDQAGIELGPKEEDRLCFQHILKDGSRPGAVFLSSCVVGKTKDVAGNPLGLVTAYLMRKAGYVVAPMAPIPDFYMPLLAGLFHYHLKSGKLSYAKALDTAKKQLRSGKWPAPLTLKVKAAYQHVLQELFRSGAIDRQLLHDWIRDEEVAELLDREIRQLDSVIPITDWLINSRHQLPTKPINLLINTTVGFG
jgi:tetratricopeptide (TPR) repeat protein